MMTERAFQTNPEINKPRHEFKTPFATVIYNAFIQEFPKQTEQFRIVVEEIDRQMIENYKVFNGGHASIPYTELVVNQDTYDRIYQTRKSNIIYKPQRIEKKLPTDKMPQRQNQDKDRLVIICTAFAAPPEGGPHTIEDMGVDRFIRELARIARIVKQGGTSPQTTICLLGSPTAFGGRVTQEWINNLKKNGFAEYGKLGAQFIKEQLKGDKIFNKRVLLSGVSKGAVVADQISQHLPSEIRRITQRLYDAPAGFHQLLDGEAIQLGLGLAAEFGLRKLRDPFSQQLSRHNKAFMAKLPEYTRIPEDDADQKKLKRRAIRAELWAIAKGTPLSEDERTFMRVGLYDPLTFGFGRIVSAFRQKEQPFNNEQRGKVSQYTTSRAHFYPTMDFKRWSTILNYCTTP